MVMYIFFVCYKLIMQDTLYTNGQKTPTSTTSVGDGIVATTSARDSIAIVASAENSNSKDAGQEEQTLEDLRTYNQASTIIYFM